MRRFHTLTLAAVLVAGIAAAHNGVQNAAVMARMNAMSGIGAGMKILGQMAKGETPFDIQIARTAASSIAGHAAKTPELFKPEETDPKSEALPSIWLNFSDFAAKAKELEVTANKLSESISSMDDLQPAMGALGASCKSCHSDYRQKRN